jgi:hypothetical protein
MIGLGSRQRRRALDRVEAAPGAALRRASPLREVPDVADRARAAAEEIRAEREDDVRAVEPPDRLERLAEDGHGSRARVVPVDRLVRMPLRSGKRGDDLADLPRERRGGHRLGEDPDPMAGKQPLALLQDPKRLEELAPSRDLSQMEEGLRAVGIVQGEDGGLRDRIGRPEASGVLGVPLDLRRSPHVALDEHARADARQLDRGREVERLAGNQVLGRLHVRDDRFLGPARAGPETRERQRRAHELQERAAARGIDPLRRPLGELPMEEILELLGLGQLLEALPVAGPRFRREPLAETGEVECRAGGSQ